MRRRIPEIWSLNSVLKKARWPTLPAGPGEIAGKTPSVFGQSDSDGRIQKCGFFVLARPSR